MAMKACETGAWFDNGRMPECAKCGTAVAWDLIEHPFFGFTAACPLKERATGVDYAKIEEPERATGERDA